MSKMPPVWQQHASVEWIKKTWNVVKFAPGSALGRLHLFLMYQPVTGNRGHDLYSGP